MGEITYKDVWKSYWEIGLIPVPSDPDKKQSILGYHYYGPIEDFNEKKFQEWADLYPDYNVCLLLTGKTITISTSDLPVTELFDKLPFDPHPVCRFRQKSRHFFKTSYQFVHSRAGSAQVKTGPGLADVHTSQVELGVKGSLPHVPPTYSHLYKQRFYWKPSPWEVDIPVIDLNLLFKSSLEESTTEPLKYKIEFHPNTFG